MLWHKDFRELFSTVIYTPANKSFGLVFQRKILNISKKKDPPRIGTGLKFAFQLGAKISWQPEQQQRRQQPERQQ